MPHTWVSKLAKDKEKGIYNQVRWYIFSNHEVGLILEQCSEGERGLFVYAFKYTEIHLIPIDCIGQKLCIWTNEELKECYCEICDVPWSTRASLAFATV